MRTGISCRVRIARKSQLLPTGCLSQLVRSAHLVGAGLANNL